MKIKFEDIWIGVLAIGIPVGGILLLWGYPTYLLSAYEESIANDILAISIGFFFIGFVAGHFATKGNK